MRTIHALHDRDSILSMQFDQSVCNLGLGVLKTPPQSPQANVLCERLLGTLRRECLDFIIPPAESRLQHLLKDWVSHYNTSRPHMSLGPGISQPLASLPVPRQAHRHRLAEHLRRRARPILSGLHHDYQPEEAA